MGMDYKIYKGIATVYGVETFDIDAVKASILATIAGRGASEALSFIVGVGWVAKAGVAAGITGIVGEVVISFMRERSPLRRNISQVWWRRFIAPPYPSFNEYYQINFTYILHNPWSGLILTYLYKNVIIIILCNSRKEVPQKYFRTR